LRCGWDQSGSRSEGREAEWEVSSHVHHDDRCPASFLRSVGM
jgi:hypothetical protein